MTIFYIISFFCLTTFGLEHIVIKDECLWKIAEKYYEDPFKWTLIYTENKNIINDPHWIFPGQKFIIPQIQQIMPVEISTPTTQIPSLVQISTPPPQVLTGIIEEQITVTEEAKERPLPSLTFIAPLDWSGDGFIISCQNEARTLLSYSDIVYLDIGKNKGLKENTKCRIYRKEKEVRHPQSREIVGIKVKCVGILKIKDVEENTATAVIEKSYEPIYLKDSIVKE